MCLALNCNKLALNCNVHGQFSMPYGNTVYVSVAFSEIVTISGSTKRINTSWGDLSYVAGDGTNVLTFSGEISTSASGTLSITGLSGTVQDLAGKSFTWSGTEIPEYHPRRRPDLRPQRLLYRRQRQLPHRLP